MMLIGPCPKRGETSAYQFGYGLVVVKKEGKWYVDSADWHLVRYEAGDHEHADPMRDWMKSLGIHGQGYARRKDLVEAITKAFDEHKSLGLSIPKTISHYERARRTDTWA